MSPAVTLRVFMDFVKLFLFHFLTLQNPLGLELYSHPLWAFQGDPLILCKAARRRSTAACRKKDCSPSNPGNHLAYGTAGPRPPYALIMMGLAPPFPSPQRSRLLFLPGIWAILSSNAIESR